MSIQYMMPGFKLTTFGTWSFLPKPQDQGSRPTHVCLCQGLYALYSTNQCQSR